MKAFLLNKKRSMFIVCFVIIFVASVFVFQAFALNGENGIVVDSSSKKEENNAVVSNEQASFNEEKTDETTNKIIDVKENNEIENLEASSQIEVVGPAKVLSQKIMDKNINFDYAELQKADEKDYIANDLYVYKSGDIEMKIDSKTDQVMSIDFDNDIFEDTKSEIPEETIKKLAVEFAGQYCDLSKYDSCVISQYKSQYTANFRKTINGYPTSQYVIVDINKDLSIAYYEKSSNSFDNIDESKFNITKEEIKQRIVEKYTQDGSFFDCNIEHLILVIKDNKVQMKVTFRELDEQGDHVNKHAHIVTYIELG